MVERDFSSVESDEDTFHHKVETFWNRQVVKIKQKSLRVDIREKMEVMIVDDNFFNIEVLQEIIQQVSPNITFVIHFNGKEALDNIISRIYQQRKIPKIIFIDINMPEMDGFELERKIRQVLS